MTREKATIEVTRYDDGRWLIQVSGSKFALHVSRPNAREALALFEDVLAEMTHPGGMAADILGGGKP